MADKIVKLPIANIARVDIVPESELLGNGWSLIEVARKANASAYTSAGIDEELRVKNTIHAQNKTEDIVKGYEIELETVMAIMEVLALVDGGKWDKEKKTYTGPVVGQAVNRELFTLNVYTEVKDYNGENTGYVKFTFLHCKGTPINFTIEDGVFMAQTMKVKSSPAFGEPPVSFEYIDELPPEITAVA